MIDELVSVAVLLCNGLVAGVLFAVALSVMPALIALPVDRYVQTHQLLGRWYDRVMPLIVVTAIVGDIALAARTDAAAAPFVLAAVLLAGVAVVSQTRNVPMNRRVKAIDPDAVPADWPDPRPAWRNWHLVRTSFAVLALAVNAAAIAWA